LNVQWLAIGRLFTMRIGYLVSEFPAVSHAFISREIEALRAHGFEIVAASIRRPGNPEALAPHDRQEMEQTAYLKPGLAVNGPAALARLAFQRPAGVVRMVRAALRLNRKGPRNLGKVAAYLLEAARLAAWARAQRVTHVHVHFGNPAAFVALLAAEAGVLTYSLSIHGPDDFYELSENVLDAKCRGAVFVRAISHFCRSQILRLLPLAEWGKVSIVHCGISAQEFAPEPAAEAPDGAFRLLCTGRLCVNKAQAVLIDAVCALRVQGIPAVLCLVGDGPERAALERQAREAKAAGAVTFVGAVGRDQVRAYIRTCDAFVLPSFAEGVPVALMEAMAMERPVVSTRIAGIPELIEHGVSGLLVAPGDSEGLADALAQLYRDPALRGALARAGRSAVVAEFDLTRSGAQMAALFSRLADGQ